MSFYDRLFCTTLCFTKIEYDAETEVLCYEGKMSPIESGVVVFATDKRRQLLLVTATLPWWSGRSSAL